MPIFEQLSKTNNVHRRGSGERYSEALSLDPLEPSAGGDSNFWDDALGFVGYGHSQSLNGMWPHYLYGCGHNVQFSDFNHSIQGCMLQPLLAMRSRMLENSPPHQENGRRAPFSCKFGARDARNRRSSTVSEASCEPAST